MLISFNNRHFGGALSEIIGDNETHNLSLGNIAHKWKLVDGDDNGAAEEVIKVCIQRPETKRLCLLLYYTDQN